VRFGEICDLCKKSDRRGNGVERLRSAAKPRELVQRHPARSDCPVKCHQFRFDQGDNVGYTGSL